MKEPYHYVIVDDDTTNNLICEFTIKRFDENSIINLFTKPEEALRFIEQEGFKPEAGATILFLDVNMPTMSGFEFLEKLGELRKEVLEEYIIYMLTSSIEDFSERAEEFPMVKGFLSKPINLNYLQDISFQLQSN